MSNIHIVHVGGRGGLGPLSKLLGFVPGIIDLTLIEAFLEDGEPITSNRKLRKLGSRREIKACIWSKDMSYQTHKYIIFLFTLCRYFLKIT